MGSKRKIHEALFLKRPNRFLGIIQLKENEVEAFIPNPGRMHELLYEGKQVYIREASSKKRKTNYDIIAVHHNDVIVSIDSNLPNRFVKKLLKNREFPIIQDYCDFKSEPSMFGGRFDFRVDSENGPTFVEVKSCTLVEDRRALFPDAPTLRGARHMKHLTKALKERIAVDAKVLFVIQRPDADVFSPNDPTDPIFAHELREASKNGVGVHAITTELVDWNLEYIREIPVQLDYFSSD